MHEPKPQKLKPRPCHAPNHASWLRGVYSNFNEHRENTERLRVCTTDSGDIVAQRLAFVRRGESLHIYAWTKHSSGTIYVAFRDPGQILKIRDCPGDSGTVGAYEYSAPFSPEMTMIVIDRDTNIYIEWHNINIINGNRKKQSLLLKGIGSGPGPSSPPLIFLPFLTWWLKTPILVYPGLSWPTITRQDSRPHFHAYRPQLLCSSVSLKIRSYAVRFTLHSSISVTCCLLATHFMRSKNLTNKKQRIFSEKHKGWPV